MNEVWNLSVIYNGFEDPAYEQDLNLLKEKSAAYVACTAGLNGKEPLEGLKACIGLEEEITLLANKLAEYAMLRQMPHSR